MAVLCLQSTTGACRLVLLGLIFVVSEYGLDRSSPWKRFSLVLHVISFREI